MLSVPMIAQPRPTADLVHDYCPDVSQSSNPPTSTVTVVEIGADGWDGLGEPVRELIRQAPLVIGGHRQQTLLPDIPGQDRRRWPTPLLPTVAALLAEYRGRHFLLIAGGSLLPGIGATLVAGLGDAAVLVVPAAPPEGSTGAGMERSSSAIASTTAGDDFVPVTEAVTGTKTDCEVDQPSEMTWPG